MDCFVALLLAMTGKAKSSYLHLQKVFEEAGAGGAGALGVELGAPEIAALDDGGERGAMLAGGQRELVHRTGKAVHEVEARVRRETCEERRIMASRRGCSIPCAAR